MMTPKPPNIRDSFAATSRGLQHNSLRRANERAVMTIIGFQPGVSNAEISRQSGLAPQTVSAILNDIDKAGLLERGEVLRGRRGQPATPLFLKHDGAFAIGIEVGRCSCTCVMIDMHANVIHQRIVAGLSATSPDLVEGIGTVIADFIALLPERLRPRLNVLGVSVPTGFEPPPVPGKKYRLSSPPPDFRGDLERRTGLDTSLYDTGNAACWCELIATPNPRPESFVYLRVSQDLSAGIFDHGELLESRGGQAVDLGGMLVPDGLAAMRPARQIASFEGLRQRLIECGETPETDDMTQWPWEQYEPPVAAWVLDSSRALALIVHNTLMIVNTDLIILEVIGPEAISQRLNQHLSEQLAELSIGRDAAPRLQTGRFGTVAPAIGAAELTLYRRHISRD